ncbi:RelA/SpoT domain-containing protein [Amycolatopsis taiwanensis]|uniref:RelA/SpoT domain-containing protein n=1 Tax=Amycolatopsis taiwanensis TaxID=342230 RepID=A0A9W6R2E7_9PSEU|nr:RelA/SpoT domain-containing protein [Amycolatopsis taiwanensis]GLY68269.1 hypothetical protein Atai01_48880 [Amycolatopsis taiwanensis]
MVDSADELPSKNQLKLAGERIRKRATGAALELDGEQALRDAQLVKRWRSAHSSALTKTRSGLGTIVMRILQLDSQTGLVTQRLKRYESIVAKLVRDKPRLGEIQDIAGCRAVLPGRETVAQVWTALGGSPKLRVEQVRDYNQCPHAGGYRALHLWCRRDGFKVEVQLRTAHQQQWAELVERWDGTLRLDIKHESAPEPVLKYFRELADFYHQLDNGVADSEADISALRAATAQVRHWLETEA